MKCKSHPCEPGVGVCASCLRERLTALIAEQNELSSSYHHHHQRRRRSDPPPPPPPLVFPRSVSPYVSRRRSAGSDASPSCPAHNQRFLRFFSTPQVGPAAGRGWFGEIDGGRRRRRFSVLKSLFGRHPRPEEAEPGFPEPKASHSGSWLLALIRGKRKKNKKLQLSAADEAAAGQQGRTRSCRAVERGMSPAMEDDDDDDDDDGSEISGDEWRRPTPTPMRRFRHHRSLGATAGLSVCLSPLVRLRPDARRRQPLDARSSGDLRSLDNSIHRRNAAVAPNRSENTTDIGKFK